MSLENKKVLVLNADRWTPFDIWSWEKAMTKIYTEGKSGVDIVENYGNIYVRDGMGNRYDVPSIVALRKYIVDMNKPATYSKKNVIYRDERICQYCGRQFEYRELTIDHVVPKSHWNPKRFNYNCSSFQNVVACCESCNFKKANRTPQKAGMELIRKPRTVTRAQAFLNKQRLTNTPKSWEIYLNDQKVNT